MKGGTVQISWHGSDPVLSVDFHPTSGLLATAGADRDIKLWSLHHVEKSRVLPTATFKSNLSYHSSAVNVVRFSPSGELLASGADMGELVIWRLVQVGEEIPSWKVWKTLRFHLKDVLDVEWSRDGAFLVSASVDNTCIIWNVNRGSVEQVLSDHQHYVQGVTWDPAGEFVVSLSSDRTCRFYSSRLLSKKNKGREKKEEKEKKLFECKHVLFKSDPAASATSRGDDIQKPVPASKQYLFYDENMASFFRRLSWSPDGSFLLLPAGVEKQAPEAAPCSLTYLVSRKELTKSSPQLTLQLPAGSKPVMGVRFCPVFFALRTKKQSTHDTNVSEIDTLELPYRLVFAVATLSSVFIYETQGSCPIAVFSGLHYAPITDLAWSSDGKFLAVSSQDGYCTLIAFDKGELGVPLPHEGSKLGGDFKTSPTAPCSVLGRSHQGKGNEDMMPLHIDEKSSSNLAPNTPGYVNGTNGVSPTEALKTMNSVKQRPQVLKMRRVTPKAITDFLEVVPTSASRGGLCTKGTCSVGLQNCTENQNTGAPSLPHQSAESQDSQSVTFLTEPEGDQSKSHVVYTSTQGLATDILPSSDPVLQACETCKADQVMSGKGPATPCSSKHMESSKLDESRKPLEELGHIYVRPLKFRRISPKPVVEESSPVTSKPLTC